MRLYMNYIKMNIRSQLQYRASFVMLSFGQFLYIFVGFLAVYFLMLKFGEMGGWSMVELGFSYGSIIISFALAEAIFRGFDRFPWSVKSGSFDRILVRPRSTALQVMGSDFGLTRIGRLAASAAIYIWALLRLELTWSFDKILVAAGMIMAGFCVFSGFFIIYAVFSFWTIDGMEIMNIVTHGTKELARVPLNVYDSGFIKFFIYIIPLGSANFLPLMYLTDRVSENTWMYALSPVLGLLFMIPCFLLWQYGVRHYKSTGS